MSRRIYAQISFDNGLNYYGINNLYQVDDLILRFWDQIVALMDDDKRERLHGMFAPCTQIYFLTQYLNIANKDIIIG